MQKLKRRKRVTALITAFMLTFLIGAAFASTNGMLDIVGNVRISQMDLMVEWTNVTEAPRPALITDGDVVHSANIDTVFLRDGRSSQRINWTITFTGEGEATIFAMAENTGAVPAVIQNMTYSWSGIDANAWGIAIDDWASTMTFEGPIAPGETRDLTLEAWWQGNVPAGFTFPPSGYITATLTVEFDYIQAS